MVSNYPVQFDVDYPSRPLHRLTTAFRFLIAIPIVVVLTMLSGAAFNDSDNSARNSLLIGGAAVFVPLVLLLVVRLDPESAALLQPGHRVPRPAGRPVSVDRRGSERPSRLRLSRSAADEPLAAAAQGA